MSSLKNSSPIAADNAIPIDIRTFMWYRITAMTHDLYHPEEAPASDAVCLWVWYWDGRQIHTTKGITHPAAFGDEALGKHYKGRYSSDLETILITLPYVQPAVLSQREFLESDDRAEALINALQKEFPKAQHIFAI